MQNRNRKKKGSGLSLGSAALIGLAVLASLAGELDSDILAPVIVVFVIIGVLAGVFTAVSKAKKKAAATQPAHSHDRLHPSEEIHCESGMEHWKNQLDGFLAAGIIDRDEYRVLWERYKARLGK